MKKITFMFMLVLGALVTSCSKSNTPEFVAEKFLTAMESANYPEAKKFCDEKTGQIVDMLAGIPISEKDKKAPKKVTINRVEEDKEDKNKAKVFYSVEGEEKEKSIDVVKIDGKWKVSLNKESKEEGHSHDHEEMHNHDHEGHDHNHEGHDHETKVQEEIAPTK